MSRSAPVPTRPSVAYSLKRCQDFVLTFLLTADLGQRLGNSNRLLLPYLASPEVSPRAMSENIALALARIHKTAEPTGVGAPVLETGMVSVSPLPPETRCIAQANASASGSDVSRPTLIASAIAMLNFQ